MLVIPIPDTIDIAGSTGIKYLSMFGLQKMKDKRAIGSNIHKSK
jgi:hypothetical protein